MAEKFIHAVYDDDDKLLDAIKNLKKNKIMIEEVFTPFPVHGLDHLLDLKPTRIAIAAFIYGCIGLTFGSLLIYYIMISGVGKSWPMNIGGKPNFTFYQNMPAFVPIMFECTVLFAGHLMSLTYFFRNKLYPGATTSSPDPRTTDDKFVIEIRTAENSMDEKELDKLIKKTGFIEIDKKTI